MSVGVHLCLPLSNIPSCVSRNFRREVLPDTICRSYQKREPPYRLSKKRTFVFRSLHAEHDKDVLRRVRIDFNVGFAGGVWPFKLDAGAK